MCSKTINLKRSLNEIIESKPQTLHIIILFMWQLRNNKTIGIENTSFETLWVRVIDFKVMREILG